MLKTRQEEFERVVRKIAKYKGLDSQYIALAEEAGELIVAASHRRRGRISKAKFLEEMADVIMLIEEFKILEGITEAQFQAMYRKKLRKFYAYVDGGMREVVITSRYVPRGIAEPQTDYSIRLV